MIVSHTHRFVFIKTAKTAGTSMMILLSHLCRDGDLITDLNDDDIALGRRLGYSSPTGLKTIVETQRFRAWRLMKQYHGDPKFMKTSGRKLRKNLSAYAAMQYLGRETWNGYFKFCFERNPFDKAVSLYFWHTRDLEVRPEVNSYIQGMPRSRLSNWDLYTIDDRVAVDFVGRYENLEDDLRRIMSRLGLSDYALPVAKGDAQKQRQHYSRLLDADTRRHIETVCGREIAELGYAWVDR